MPGAFELRPIGPADALDMAETVRMGFESYREWAPAGWDPPSTELEGRQIAERLDRDDVWGRIARVEGAAAGHVTFVPARLRDEQRTVIPGLAHLWQMFVRPPWWGSGLAARLLALAVEEAARRGFPAMRLYTPTHNARGRAFYEREGWQALEDSHYEPMLGLDIVQYRRDLPASRP